MTSRTTRPTLVALTSVAVACVALSACSATISGDETAPIAGGSIGLALSETCRDDSDLQCVSVNGESVMLPLAFERADVEGAVAIDGQNAIALTLSADGAEVLRTLTERAAEGADTARLVVAIDDELLAAVRVIEPLTGATVHLALPPDTTAQDLIALFGEK